MKQIGKSFKEIREQKNISVYQIEKDIDIKHQSLYKYEQGEREPSIIACIKLAAYYNVTLDYLLGLEDETGSKIYNNYGIHNGDVNFKW